MMKSKMMASGGAMKSKMMASGGKAAPAKKMASGGMSYAKGGGIETKGKTKGKMITMAKGGKA
jgi:hypothetical protein